MNEPINASVAVRRSPEDAFRIFTQDMGSWWPLQGFSMAEDTYADRGVKAETIVWEEREGGRVYEVMSDGTEGTWATILDGTRRGASSWRGNRTSRTTRRPSSRSRSRRTTAAPGSTSSIADGSVSGPSPRRRVPDGRRAADSTVWLARCR